MATKILAQIERIERVLRENREFMETIKEAQLKATRALSLSTISDADLRAEFLKAASEQADPKTLTTVEDLKNMADKDLIANYIDRLTGV